jgi:electron transfer flavoprotein alpha subunit
MPKVKSNQENKKILIIAEKEDGKLAPITFELLRAGRVLSEEVQGILCAAVIGHKVEQNAIEIAHFSDEVFLIDNILLADFQADLYIHSLENLCRRIEPDTVLMGHTLKSLDLAPRLAHRIGTKLITDCIDFKIEIETGQLLCTKPVYGGNAVATFINEKKPQMVTLRSRVFEGAEESPDKAEVISFDPCIDQSLAKTETIENVLGEVVNLDNADLIVAGGRGIKKVEGLKLLEEFIDVLRGYFSTVELGASRPLVDAGWLPPSRQLGLTGEKVSPELYIAIGISGSMQHLTGVFNSKRIIAINIDDGAPVFNYADYGLVGNYEDVIPALIKKLRELA